MAKTEENKKIFKNKWQMLICFVLFVLFIIGFMYLSKQDYSLNNINNNTITEEKKEIINSNIFEEINSTDAYNLAQKKDVIILFGSSSKWVAPYVSILEEVAEELNVTKIYYYDIEKDRADDNASYESIVNYLEDNIYHLDGEITDLYTPTLLIKEKGSILLFDDETATIKGKYTPDEYWDEYKINDKKIILRETLKDYME